MRLRLLTLVLMLVGFVAQIWAEPVIYEVNLRAFSAKGDFAGVEARLDNLKRLGVDVVWLMPIYPVGKLKSVGDLGSPYCIQDYKAINPEFGDEKSFRSLVAGIHRRHMRVILDWVANHTSWDNLWVNQHPEWYLHDSKGAIIHPPGTNWNDVAALDYKNREMRSAMVDAMAFWVTRFAVDGFRCDYADGPPSDFWKDAISQLQHRSAGILAKQ